EPLHARVGRDVPDRRLLRRRHLRGLGRVHRVLRAGHRGPRRPRRGVSLVAPAARVVTPYPDVNAVLQALVSGVQAILGPRLVGFYLDGSLAIGDFDPASSDVDFVTVLADEMPGDAFRALQALHARLAREPSKWGQELEGSYITRAALGGRDPWPAAHPYIDRGEGLTII